MDSISRDLYHAVELLLFAMLLLRHVSFPLISGKLKLFSFNFCQEFFVGIEKGPNYWGNSTIFELTTGEAVGPTGEISPVVTLKKMLWPIASPGKPCRLT